MTEYRIEPEGTLEAREDGLYMEYAARCPLGKPIHLELLFENGTVPLGVPQPDGDAMTLHRRLSRSSLAPLGALTGCRVFGTAAAQEDWVPISHPEVLFSDPSLRALSGCSGAKFCRDGQDTLLAVPYDPNAPFPLLPVFCLACPARISGRAFLLIRIRGGVPVAAESEE